MQYEVETKILNVDKAAISSSLAKLGAEKVAEARLFVDWFRRKGVQDGEDPWFLRIRKYSSGKSEVTWKGVSDKFGVARKHKEINFEVSDLAMVAALFDELELEKYAHQEKDRVSWVLKNWRFDLDQYPGMVAYLEIEGSDDGHIREAIELLGLVEHETSSEGERKLIQNKYGINWYEMRFE